MATIDDLPNEILLKIFEQVPKKKGLTRTCQRWNSLLVHWLHMQVDLSYMENIMKFLKMEFTRPYQKLTIIGVMLLRPDFNCSGPFLRSKRPRHDVDPYIIIRKCLEVVRQLEPYVRELSLSFGPMADKSLLAFLPRWGVSRLESLAVLFNCVYIGEPADWIIHQMDSVAEDGIREVVEMPNLRKLHYEDRRSKGDRAVRRKFFDTIVRKAKGITDIKLKCTGYACYPDFRIVRSFSQQLLRVSCVIWPIFMKDFFQLTFSCAKAMRLDFAYCTTTPDKAYHFFESALCLTDLSVENVHNSEFYQQGVSRCTKLEKLSINGRHEIAMDGLRSLEKLKELYLYSSQEWAAEQNAVPCSRTLEKLVLDRCTVGFTFYSVLSNNVPQITELHITGDELFDDVCLQAVCTSMVNLRRLKLTLMTFVEDPVTESGFQYIGNLRKLEYLYLESFDGGFFSPHNNPYPLFTDWVQRLTASKIHLKGFRKFSLQNLLEFMLNSNLKVLVLEHCGKGFRLIDGYTKLKQLKDNARSLPNVMLINDG